MSPPLPFPLALAFGVELGILLELLLFDGRFGFGLFHAGWNASDACSPRRKPRECR